MSGLSASKIAILNSVIQAAPDDAIRSLEVALADSGDGLLAAVRLMVETEALDRAVRDGVFAILSPLCAARDGQTFPANTVQRLWRAVKATARNLVAQCVAAFVSWSPGEATPEAADIVCAHAAERLRAEDPAFEGFANLDVLTRCLDLSPIVRAASHRQDEWISRITGERVAALRLAYRDAVAISDDAGPLFFDLLSAQLPEPWLVVRAISAVMDRPSERYLSASELSVFGERILVDIQRSVEAVRAFDPAGGPAAGRQIGKLVERAVQEIADFETSVQLSRDSGWGARLIKLKQGLAERVEAHLATLDKTVAAATPVERVRMAGKLSAGGPDLSLEPNEAALRKAAGLLAFADEVRVCAVNAGFGSLRAKVIDQVNERLDDYVEQLLERMRSDDNPDVDRIRRFLDGCAGLMAYSRDEKAAQIVRRRAAAA